MAQLDRRHTDPWLRDIQVASTSTGLDSHDIGTADSGLFRFQDGEEQGGKRAIGPWEAIVKSIRTFAKAEPGRHSSSLDSGQPSAKTGKKITPLTQRAKSSNVSRSLPGESQALDK